VAVQGDTHWGLLDYWEYTWVLLT